MRRFSYVILIVAIAGCTDDPQVTQPTRVVEKRFPTASYDVHTLTASLGGALSVGNGINNRGWVAGYSSRGDQTRHAALWRDGAIEALGTLGGPNSAVLWPGLNDRGMVVGIAETSLPIPSVRTGAAPHFSRHRTARASVSSGRTA